MKNKGRKVGRLRFKGKGWFKTFTYNQSGFKLVKSGKRLDLLHLSKIGDVPVRVHRQIEGRIKQVTIKRHSSGKWFACICVEKEINFHDELFNPSPSSLAEGMESLTSTPLAFIKLGISLHKSIGCNGLSAAPFHCYLQ